MIGHITPEATLGGPIGLVEDGDIIEIDIDARQINLKVADDVLQQRRAVFAPPPAKYTTGFFGRYGALVGSASEGAVLRAG
jgi:dihydroxy-acid dehydratase